MLGSSRANACAAPSSRSAALSALSNVRSESHRRNGDAMVVGQVLSALNCTWHITRSRPFEIKHEKNSHPPQAHRDT